VPALARTHVDAAPTSAWLGVDLPAGVLKCVDEEAFETSLRKGVTAAIGMGGHGRILNWLQFCALAK
jgi:hypothetical protein